MLEKRCDVLNLDALTYAGNLASLRAVEGKPNYRFVHANICDREAVERRVREFAPDRIMHLAAESHVDRSITGAATSSKPTSSARSTCSKPRETTGRSWTGRAATSASCTSRQTRCMARSASRPFHEETPYDPSSPYSASKASSDHLAKAWQRTYGLPVVVSNCSNNYGPYHFPEKLIPLTILNALAGEHLPVYGRGENVRDWLYVEDHARALDLIAERGRVGETYNVGGRNERRNIDVVRRICEVLDELSPANRPRHELISYVTDRPGHDARYAIDATKLETELGWRAQ